MPRAGQSIRYKSSPTSLRHLLHPRPAPKPRYCKPRRLINWAATRQLKIVKMLAWCVMRYEGRIGALPLACRVDQLLRPIAEAILGVWMSRVIDLHTPLTLNDLLRHTEERQGVEATPEKLYQRADKAIRYSEFNRYKDRVEELYLEHVARGA